MYNSYYDNPSCKAYANFLVKQTIKINQSNKGIQDESGYVKIFKRNNILIRKYLDFKIVFQNDVPCF